MKRLLVLVSLPFLAASGLLVVGTIALIKKVEEDFDEDIFWE
jgi:hypothetical protein